MGILDKYAEFKAKRQEQKITKLKEQVMRERYQASKREEIQNLAAERDKYKYTATNRLSPSERKEKLKKVSEGIKRSLSSTSTGKKGVGAGAAFFRNAGQQSLLGGSSMMPMGQQKQGSKKKMKKKSGKKKYVVVKGKAYEVGGSMPTKKASAPIKPQRPRSLWDM